MGAPTLGGPPKYKFVRISHKLHEIKKILGCGWGEGACRAVPLGSATDKFEFPGVCYLCLQVINKHSDNFCSGGSKGGARDARPPLGSKFFHFHAVFGRKNRLAHPFWELAPPPGKIRHCSVFNLNNEKKISFSWRSSTQKFWQIIGHPTPHQPSPPPTTSREKWKILDPPLTQNLLNEMFNSKCFCHLLLIPN